MILLIRITGKSNQRVCFWTGVLLEHWFIFWSVRSILEMISLAAYTETVTVTVTETIP